jgi:hypothetical protein
MAYYSTNSPTRKSHHPEGSGYQFAISSLLPGIPCSWAKNGYQVFKSSLRSAAGNVETLNFPTGTFAVGRRLNTDHPSTNLKIRNLLTTVDIHSAYPSDGTCAVPVTSVLSVQSPTKYPSAMFRLARQPAKIFPDPWELPQIGPCERHAGENFLHLDVARHHHADHASDRGPLLLFFPTSGSVNTNRFPYAGHCRLTITTHVLP